MISEYVALDLTPEIVPSHPLIKGMGSKDQTDSTRNTQLDLGASVLWTVELIGQQRQRKYITFF